MFYREEVLRTLNPKLDETAKLTNGAMGLCGEAGEVSDIVKKHLFQGKPLSKERLIDELSDVRWYLELLCITLGVTIEEVEVYNVLKLRNRYPNGFVANVSRENEK